MIGKVQDLVLAAVVIGATESTPGINETAAPEAASSTASQDQQTQQDMAETAANDPTLMREAQQRAKSPGQTGIVPVDRKVIHSLRARKTTLRSPPQTRPCKTYLTNRGLTYQIARLTQLFRA